MTQTALPHGSLPVPSRSAPPGHRHPLFVIRLTLLWYLDAHVSLRGIVLVLATLLGTLAGCLPARLPCPSTVRGWLLRVGLYLLRRRPLGRRADWVWILDHTIQLGKQKCLLILGASLDAVRRGPLTHRDVTVLSLRVTSCCTGEFVAECLRELAGWVGLPVQLVSDHGADLAKGIRLFQEDNPEVVDTYDVTHRLACLVKAELEPDARWGELLRRSSASLVALQQTAGSFLVPPAGRTRSRYLNVDGVIDWSRRMLRLLRCGKWAAVAGLLRMGETEASRFVEEKLGWLREFGGEVERYARVREVVRRTQEEVKRHGLSAETAERVWEGLGAEVVGDERLGTFLGGVRKYLEEEGGKVPRGERWLGTSDVLESLFGRYKWLGEKAPHAEVGAGVLAMAAMTGELSEEVIREALAAVSGQDVRDWVMQNLSQSTLSKVRALGEIMREAEPTQEADTKAA